MTDSCNECSVSCDVTTCECLTVSGIVVGHPGSVSIVIIIHVIPSALGLSSSTSVLPLAFIYRTWSRRVVCSLQLIPLIGLNCDAVAIPFNDTVEYSPALLEVWVFPEFLFPDLTLWDIILMKNSTAVRCPPIVMSSPCTVATMSSL